MRQDKLQSCGYGLAGWLSPMSVRQIKDHRDFLGQPLELVAAKPFGQHLPASGPRRVLPAQGTGDARRHLVLEQPPETPPRGRARPI
jgi:hypothetical protein